MDSRDQEQSMENREILAALSEAMADAVAGVGKSVVRVHGRRRHPGSGTVFAEDVVLTAGHVLEREEDLSVETADGRSLPARLAGRDHATNLAALRVEGLGVEAATPAEAEARVGQISLAVASPGRGDGPRATAGIVSSVGGPIRSRRGPRLERYLQTDAAPFPGLSGGPLIDVEGRVLGIMTAGWGRGAAFAVPAQLAWRVARALREGGSVRRGYLGILSQPVRLPKGDGSDQGGGLLVVGVEDGSPADGGGLMVGDIVATLDGLPVEDTDDLLALLAGERVGRSVPVGVVRGGEPRELHVTVGERG